jgi:hypothetical protein
MLTSYFFLLAILTNPTVTPPIHAIARGSSLEQKDTDEFTKRKKEAGKDVPKLWKLYEWCKEQKKDKEAKATLKDLLKIDPLHKEANIAAGNLFFEGKWFESQAKIEEYKKQKAIDEKHAQGLVEYKGEWVPKEDVPFLEKGLVKDDVGNWVSGDEAKKLKEGYVKQDLAWIPPAEKANIEKGLWKCGDKWLPLTEADSFHAELYQEWRIPFERFNVWTTCDRDLVTAKMKRQLDPAMEELDRIYGVKPQVPINVCILRSIDQYNKFAAGDEEEQIQGNEMLGMSSGYQSYLADAFFDEDGTSLNMGVSYWDATTDAGNKFGVHNIRHAIGQSYAEAIDPSTDALASLRKSKNGGKDHAKKFYAEKRIPTWFRFGAAAYVERYYKDTTLGIGGNPKWTKEWSIQNLLKDGGLRPLKQVLECKIKPSDPVDTRKLINETGLVMGFIMDGGCAPVIEKHKALQEAFKNMKERKPIEEAAKALEAEIIKNEAELRKYGGL